MNIKTGTGDIRVAIVGVGNCANSLVQGVTYYKDAAIDQEIPGLMHAVIGNYHINNVKFVAAFDVDAKKVGLDLADAIWASENNTIKFSDVAKTGVTVARGVTLDGLGKYYKETIAESTAAPVDVVAMLKEEAVDVLIGTSTLYQLPFWLGGTVNLGLKNLLTLAQSCHAKWILNTHDEAKLGTGVVERFANKEYVENHPQIKFLKTGESFEYIQ